MGKLSIVTVTRGAEKSLPFLREMERLATLLDAQFVIGLDHNQSDCALVSRGDFKFSTKMVSVGSAGYIESVLDTIIEYCDGDYVLRLDDDERCSPAMIEWLQNENYLAHDHWCFPRMHMWPTEESVILAPQLFPDHQTRLSVKAKSGARRHIHAMSPYGMGVCAPVAIEHHKFLIRSRAEREETSRKWHSDGMLAFSLPEDALNVVKVVSRGTGVVPWLPETVREMQMGDDDGA